MSETTALTVRGMVHTHHLIIRPVSWPFQTCTGYDTQAENRKQLLESEDLKAYYAEALLAQPGQATDAARVANWFWGETAAARVLNAIRIRCLGSDDSECKLLGTLLLIPRNQLHRFSG